MSDRIIRAATVGSVRAWVPQVIAASSGASASLQGIASGRQPDATSAFTPSQEAQIRDALEQAHARGEQHGFQMGFEQGLNTGLEQGLQQAALQTQQHKEAQVVAQQTDSLVAALQDALMQVQQQEQAVQAQLPQWVTDIALAVARQVVGQVAGQGGGQVSAGNANDLANRIHAAIENVSDTLRAQMQLVMHPQTREQLAQLKSAAAQDLLAHVREDETLAPGGFLVRTAHGQLDHTIESRWRRAVETFSSDAAHQRWV